MTKGKGEQWVICPEADTCMEDCECKEPHLKKDCMRGDPADPDLSEDCFVECVPTNKKPEITEKVKVEHLTILYDGGKL